MLLIMKYVLFSIFFFLILGITSIILLINHLKRVRYEKMYSDVKNALLTKFGDDKLRIDESKDFDFRLEDSKEILYIKLIPNFSNSEIDINNRDLWEIKKDYNSDKISFVEGIINPIYKKLEESTKAVKKVFIIYPNAKQLLVAVNECEYEFVTPRKEIYGYHVLTYRSLLELLEEF